MRKALRSLAGLALALAPIVCRLPDELYPVVESTIPGMGSPEQLLLPEPLYRALVSEETTVALYAAVAESLRDTITSRMQESHSSEVAPLILLHPQVNPPEFVAEHYEPKEHDAELLERMIESGAVDGVCDPWTGCRHPEGTVATVLVISRPYRAKRGERSVFITQAAGWWNDPDGEATGYDSTPDGFVLDFASGDRYDLKRVRGRWRVVRVTGMWVT